MYEEGERCPMGCGGWFHYYVAECTCFICPPCYGCENALLECNRCGWTEGDSTTSSRAFSESFNTPNLFLSLVIAERSYRDVSRWVYPCFYGPHHDLNKDVLCCLS